MEFRNERTWQNAVELGKTEEFHVSYETAVDKVRSEFGQTLPMIIDGKEVRTTATFPDVSPADIRVVLGLFQHGTKADAKRAIKAARAAFPTWSATPWAERVRIVQRAAEDRKSTRLNSSHVEISYAVFCLKKKKDKKNMT